MQQPQLRETLITRLQNPPRPRAPRAPSNDGGALANEAGRRSQSILRQIKQTETTALNATVEIQAK